MALEIKPDASLVVRAPRRTSLEQVHRFIGTHSEWIKLKQEVALERPHPEPKMFIDGEEFLYLGHICRLRLIDIVVPPVAYDGDLLLSTGALPRARDVIIKWYKSRARQIFTERVIHYAALMGCQPSALRITSPERRWGSCGAGGGLNFNWKVVMAPQEVIDYLVVHELAHLKHRGHSREFWDFVKRFCPEFRQRQLWLKNNSYRLEI
ncbi:zinc metalloprotease [Dehalogenimonas sp. WBC-2]|nr:zinc metalloprotease [Dehalogenimonas sp. WBC-2]